MSAFCILLAFVFVTILLHYNNTLANGIKVSYTVAVKIYYGVVSIKIGGYL